MGMLISGLPTAIMVCGRKYPINADYVTCIKIIMAFEDNELAAIEKAMLLVEFLYKEKPYDIAAAVEKGVKFLDCGECASCGSLGEAVRKYSFSHDDKYIFAGVDKVLNGRLSKGDFVHWWEFVMAFMELPEDCTMSRIIYFRTQNAKGKLTKEERRMWNENRDIFELPNITTAEEEAAVGAFMEQLGK